MPETVERYYSLSELWKNIKALPARRKYLAGGSDLVISSVYGGDDSQCWIDISGIRELHTVKETAGEIYIGSCMTISELADNRVVKKWIPALAACAPFYASPGIRNFATIGGNAANASPSADGVCALAATGAYVILNLKGKRRKLPILSLIKGPKKTALHKDELIEGFVVPKWKHRAIFLKMMPRKMFGIAKASICLCYSVENGIAKRLGIALGSVGPVIISPEKTIAFLKGKKLTPSLVQEASCLIRTEINPITDLRSQAHYRKDMIQVLLERAFREVMNSGEKF